MIALGEEREGWMRALSYLGQRCSHRGVEWTHKSGALGGVDVPLATEGVESIRRSAEGARKSVGAAIMGAREGELTCFPLILAG
jgi:hypothetical protein